MEIIKNRFKKNDCLGFLSNINGSVFISVLTVSIVWHYAKPENHKEVEEFLDQFEVLDLTNKELEVAYQIWKNNDLEDALQIATCLNFEIYNFLTLDKKLANKYKDLVSISLL